MVNKLIAIAFVCLSVCLGTTVYAAWPSSGKYGGTPYVGPGDVVPGASAWWGLRSYSQATVLNPAIAVRRASDNQTTNISTTGLGDLNVAAATAFGGIDATCTGTATSPTINFTGCSSTPTVSDTLAATSLTQPSYLTACGSFSGGAGSCTMNTTQTISAASVQAQVALYVTELYDQTGNGFPMVQATAGNQAQLLPSCFNGLPCLLFSGVQFYQSSCPVTTFDVFSTILAQRTGNFANQQTALTWCSDTSVGDAIFFWGNPTNTKSGAYAGNNSEPQGPSLGASVDLFSWLVPVFGESTQCLNNTCLDYDAGNKFFGLLTNTTAGAWLGSNTGPVQQLTGYIIQAGVWQGTVTTTQVSALCTNDNNYWYVGALSCNTAPPAPVAFTNTTGPCDLITCTEAWSVTRAMVNSYHGPLFQLWNPSNYPGGRENFLDVQQNPTTRQADLSTWSAYCGGVPANCYVTKVYGQVHVNKGNDLVGVNFVGGACPAFTLFNSCAAPFAIETATTGLPILNTVTPRQYSLNNNINGGDDSPIVGLPDFVGTQSGGVAENILFPSMTEAANICCGSFGTDHYYLQPGPGGQIAGSDFSITPGVVKTGGVQSCTSANTYCLGWDAEQGGTPGCGGVCNIGSGPDIGVTQISAFIAGDHDQSSTTINQSYNSHFGYYNIPVPHPTISLTSASNPTGVRGSAFLHLAGGGDLGVPAPIHWREGFIYPSTMNSTVYSSIFANETAFYNALSFP